MTREEYIIKALTEQRDELANKMVLLVAEANVKLEELQRKLDEMEESKCGESPSAQVMDLKSVARQDTSMRSMKPGE